MTGLSIVVIGGGPAATAALSRLVWYRTFLNSPSVAVVQLFVPDKVFGKSAPWSTPVASHITNMPAHTLGPSSVNPEAIVEGLNLAHLTKEHNGDVYLRRDRVGDALCADLVRQIGLLRANGVSVTVHRKKVADIEPIGTDRVNVIDEEGAATTADGVLLATGNWEPDKYVHLRGTPFYAGPWQIDEVRPLFGKRLLIIGTSLSSIDLTHSWRFLGNTRPVVWGGTSGIIPGVRPLYRKPSAKLITPEFLRDFHRVNGPLSLEAVIQLAIAEIVLNGGNCDDLVKLRDRMFLEHLEQIRIGVIEARMPHPYYDALKIFDDVVHIVWDFMSEAAKDAFKQYSTLQAAIQWPAPPKNMVKLGRWIGSGFVTIRRGIREVEWDNVNDRYVATFADGQVLDFQAVADCSGIGSDIRDATCPLMASLLRRSLVKRHPRGGVIVDKDTGRIGAGGEQQLPVWVCAGSLTKGTHYLTNQLLTVTATARAGIDDMLNSLNPATARAPTKALVI
ncbi:FAD/NAD(P)-binding protein [Aquibium carbonis]|uniref:FAD/NAD(P)-binding protein n=1 Tax=Aquibium carbonis TaxID=2495581 RepID=UPI0014794BD3|nr:FAD/NAD(P)-binding protein [Aquibium carbonis]